MSAYTRERRLHWVTYLGIDIYFRELHGKMGEGGEGRLTKYHYTNFWQRRTKFTTRKCQIRQRQAPSNAISTSIKKEIKKPGFASYQRKHPPPPPLYMLTGRATERTNPGCILLQHLLGLAPLSLTQAQ